MLEALTFSSKVMRGLTRCESLFVHRQFYPASLKSIFAPAKQFSARRLTRSVGAGTQKAPPSQCRLRPWRAKRICLVGPFGFCAMVRTFCGSTCVGAVELGLFRLLSTRG